MTRAGNIIAGLNDLVDAEIIVGYTRLGQRWLVQTRTLQHYFTHDEADAFLKGAEAAKEVSPH